MPVRLCHGHDWHEMMQSGTDDCVSKSFGKVGRDSGPQSGPADPWLRDPLLHGVGLLFPRFASLSLVA